MTRTLTATPADILTYQRQLVRTGKVLPLGRMQKIAIGPSADYNPQQPDPYIQRFGRLIELRDRMLPIAQDEAKEFVLVCAPLMDRDGHVKLPDLPDPAWTRPALTDEEITGRMQKDPVTGQMRRMLVEPDPAKHQAPMIPQRLTDRCEMKDGEPAVLEGTNFLVFQPVIRVAFQPEIANRMVGTAWWLEFFPDSSGRHCALLVDKNNGECFFFGGRYDVLTPTGE